LMQEATANESARTEFKQATDAALSIGRASFLEGFPEFANLPMTHWENALRAMHQREPQRFNKAVAILQRVGAAEQMQTNLKAHEAREFKNYVASENQKFAERHKGEKLDPSAVMETLKSVGVDPTTFLKEYDGSRILRSAEAQAIMVKAAKYDALMKKQEAARNAPKPKPAARAVAPVIRPGASQPRANQSAMDARTLVGKATASGSLEDAVRALSAQRSASKIGRR
jgi:hypothetical protein